MPKLPTTLIHIANEEDSVYIFFDCYDYEPIEQHKKSKYFFSDELQRIIFKYFFICDCYTISKAINETFNVNTSYDIIRRLCFRKYNLPKDTSVKFELSNLTMGVCVKVFKRVTRELTNELKQLSSDSVIYNSNNTEEAKYTSVYTWDNYEIIENGETWRGVIELPKLLVSNTGKVKNKNNGYLYKQYKNNSGRYTITNNNKTILINRLVCFIYHGDIYKILSESNINDNIDVDHINHDPENNNADNLRFMFQKWNIKREKFKNQN